MAQLQRQGQTPEVSVGTGTGLPPAFPANTPAGSHLQASVHAVPSARSTLSPPSSPREPQHPFWCRLGEVIKPRHMKPITVFLSHCQSSISQRNQDKESYTTEHVSLFTLAARELRVKFTSNCASS